jgi:hypothetical protein
MIRASLDENSSSWRAASDETPILEYVYGESEDPNPSFRVVNTLGGRPVALYHPWDHPWHTGLFFSWKYIDGHNFWEAKYAGERNSARVDSIDPSTTGRGFKQASSYTTEAGEVLLKEDRIVDVEGVDGGYVLYMSFGFRPAGARDVLLDRTPRTASAPWGGYAGLSCRLDRCFLDPAVTTERGTGSSEEADTGAYPWCDYSGKLDGWTEPRWAGVCIMDHPANPRHPSPMLTYDYKDMQFLQAAFLLREPYLLRAGEELKLRYACFVHDGKGNQECLGRLWTEFAKS